MKNKWMMALMVSVLLSLGVSGCAFQGEIGEQAIEKDTQELKEEPKEELKEEPKEESEEESQGEAENVGEEEEQSGQEKDVKAYLYYPDDELLEMLQVPWYGEISKEQELYDAWEESAKLDTDTQVLGFDGTTLDLSNQFAILINNYGTSGEIMYIEGLTTTFKEYYSLSEIYITVEGEVLETGHNIYDYAL